MNLKVVALVVVLVTALSSVCSGQAMKELGQQNAKYEELWQELSTLRDRTDDCEEMLLLQTLIGGVDIWRERNAALIMQLFLLSKYTDPLEIADAQLSISAAISVDLFNSNQLLEMYSKLEAIKSARLVRPTVSRVLKAMRETTAYKSQLSKSLIESSSRS